MNKKEILKKIVKKLESEFFMLFVGMIWKFKKVKNDFYLDEDLIFEKLQKKMSPTLSYGYSSVDLWERATQRSVEVMKLLKDSSKKKKILEVGCGDGTLSYVLNCAGYDVTSVDIRDWLDERAKNNIQFYAVDFSKDDLPFEKNSFDMIISYNCFEHISEPDKVYPKLLDYLKPKGQMFLKFSPLYYSPKGLHAYKFFKMPYPQELFSEEFLTRKLIEMNVLKKGEHIKDMQHLNKWTKGQFCRLWRSDNRVNIIKELYKVDKSESLFMLKYRKYLNKKLEDLLVTGIEIVLEKKAD